jgi:hypothetical protein
LVYFKNIKQEVGSDFIAKVHFGTSDPQGDAWLTCCTNRQCGQRSQYLFWEEVAQTFTEVCQNDHQEGARRSEANIKNSRAQLLSVHANGLDLATTRQIVLYQALFL